MQNSSCSSIQEFIHSKWPMQELSAFVEAKKSGKNVKLILLSIFFMINRNELSNLFTDGPEWEKLEESDARIGEWQEAINAVRHINGLTFGEDGNEVNLRDEVLKKICSILRGINPPKLFEFKPVGIEKQMLEVEALLDIEGSESALALIVYGFGGIGKITASVVQSLDWSSTDLIRKLTKHLISLTFKSIFYMFLEELKLVWKTLSREDIRLNEL